MAGPTRRGRPPHPDLLTPAEWRVVNGVRHGLSNRQIARARGISLDAVKGHVSTAVAKLGLAGRRSLALWAGAPRDSAIRRKGVTVTAGTLTGELQGIGQVARRVVDVSRAEAWYRDVLGLTHLYTFPSAAGDLAFLDCGGTRLMLSQEGPHTPGAQSVLYFRVPDIHAAQAALGSRGAEFVAAPHMIFKHADGTEEWMAFFRDCDGELLALMSA